MIIQFCGLSGAGKTTLARAVEKKLEQIVPIEVIDGDEYRQTICKGLGFSKEDRFENIRRMAFVAGILARHGIVPMICAISPYQEIRSEITKTYSNVKIVHVDCPLSTLQKRDTKGLYRKATLPDDHPDKIKNLTGVSDPFEVPDNPDLYINTKKYSVNDCRDRIAEFILKHMAAAKVIRASFDQQTYYRSNFI